MHTLCSPGSPPICRPCTVCKTYEHIERPCTLRMDAACTDELSISFNVDSPASQALQDVLFGLLSNITYEQIDPGYFTRWSLAHGGHNHIINSLGDMESVLARYLNCSQGEYRDDDVKMCKPCSICPLNHYQSVNCTYNNNSICLPCSACAHNQYMVKACETYSDTLCFNYAVRSITMNITILSTYANLFDAYIPGFITAMQIQLAAESVQLKSAYMSGGQQELKTYSFVVTFLNVYERVPNKEHEYSVIAERALLLIESVLYNTSMSIFNRRLLSGRRLLQIEDADGFCEPDYYVYAFNSVQLCVSCENDFNPLTADNTPYLLRFFVAINPCPNQFARRLF